MLAGPFGPRSIKMNEKIIVSNQHKCIHTIKKTDTNRTVPLHDMRTVKPFGVDDDEQIAFFLSLTEIISDDKVFTIIMPNLIALSLSNFKRNIGKGLSLLKALKKKHNQSTNKLDNDDDLINVYDCFEYIEIAIVSLYMAVESFANTCIPDSYKYHKQKNNGVEEIYDKSAIEKHIATSEKLTEILPDILKLENPNQRPFWSGFKEIENLRNRIIHCKENATSSLLQDLFNYQNIKKYIKDTLDLLEFYVSRDTYNMIFPMGFGKSTIPIFDISEYLEDVK